MSQCKKCGTELLDTAKFCVNCGTPVEVAAENPVNETPVVETPVVEEPIAETPVVEEPVVEEPAPSTDYSAPEASTPVNPTPVAPTPVAPTPVNPGFNAQPQQPQMTAYQQAYTNNVQQTTAYQQAYATNGQRTTAYGQVQKKGLPVGAIIGIILGAVAFFLIVVIVACVLIFGGKSYEKPINKFEKGVNKGDASIIMEAFPEVASTSTYMYSSMTDYCVGIEDLEIEIYDTEKLTGYDLTDVREYSDFAYLAPNGTLNVTEAYDCYVTINYKEYGVPSTEYGVITVGKIDGKWYIVDIY